jgi:hypothetical protein
LADVQAAADRIRGKAHITPLLTCSTLDRLAGHCHLFFKCEQFQRGKPSTTPRPMRRAPSSLRRPRRLLQDPRRPQRHPAVGGGGPAASAPAPGAR